MTDYPTLPNPKLQPPRAAHKPMRPLPAPPRPQQPPRRPLPRKQARRVSRWLLIVPILCLVLAGVLTASTLVGVRMAYGDAILPQVYVGDVALGGMSEAEAAQTLRRAWGAITLRDQNRRWQTNAAALGVTLDAERTAAAAFRQGHGEGGLTALFSRVQVPPAVQVDAAALSAELTRLSAQINIAAVNAGVALVNGSAQATPPQTGRALDIPATVAQTQRDGLSDHTLDLVMRDVAPQVSDSAPLVREAQALLSNPLDVRVFDPVTGDSVYWSAAPDEWGPWLTAVSDPTRPIGLALDADAIAVRQFLEAQASRHFDATRTLDFDSAVQTVREAIRAGRPQAAYVVVRHRERTHTVQAGETLTSIAWDYGIPYPYIQALNNGLEALAIGQTLAIPPADSFLLEPVVPDKRIVVSISQQRTRVYEDGALKWDWIASTGIDSSPTWPGVYQVISREPNAYAGNWNLYMPNFIGVYQPVPGAAFTNGFHGFPTRGGGQLLWENSLGTRVTYGCILLSDADVQALYQWAEEGVVVEILP